MYYTAYNTATGEILQSTRRASLRKLVAYATQLDKEYFGCKAHWVFSRRVISALVGEIF